MAAIFEFSSADANTGNVLFATLVAQALKRLGSEPIGTVTRAVCHGGFAATKQATQKAPQRKFDEAKARFRAALAIEQKLHGDSAPVAIVKL